MIILVFSSIEFLVKFLPVFLLLYYITPKKLRNVTLIMGSFFFYASADMKNFGLLLVMICVNFGIGRCLGTELLNEKRIKKSAEKSRFKARVILAVAIFVNVVVLFVFKRAPEELLPMGISFYTFQTLSYLIDVYRGEIRAERSLIRYTAYISMFPQAASGPIVYYGEVEADLKKRSFSMELFDEGAKQFVIGLVFKVLLADRIAILWHEIQTTGFISISTPLAWLGAYGYSMQIYFDFCGYSLMAVGLGKMLGFHLPENFDLPYAAGSIRDFYRRWHMTLGRWFCKYIYIPLGGSRKGMVRTVLNLLAVWVLTSLWHGESLNYLFWGLSLWLFISLEKLNGFGDRKRGLFAGCLSHLYVWLVIPITWIFFAITDVEQLRIYLGRMSGLTAGINVNPGDIVKALNNYGVLLAMCIFACLPVFKKLYERFKNTFTGMAVLAVLFWYCVWRILVEGNNPFMYLNF